MFLVFNGPPRSGKDQCCSIMRERMNFSHVSFKEQLIKETINYYGVTHDWFMKTYNDILSDGTPIKEITKQELGGRSRRQALIHVSEDIYKPQYGKEYFGQKLSENLNVGSNYCCSDGGFTEEIIPLINKFGKKNVFVVQLFRDGSDFSNDSRRYLNANLIEEFVNGNKKSNINQEHILKEKVDVDMFRIHNNGSIDELYETIGEIIRKIETL